MTKIEWSKPGERRFQTGVDRGVLYPPGGQGVPWNGLTSVEESGAKDTSAFYLDGVKYLERQTPGEFAGTLKAFTYPRELDGLTGIGSYAPGVNLHDQRSKQFGLSYRTLIGDDAKGVDAGYTLHIIYNVFASPDTKTFVSLGDTITPTDFSWALSAIPQKLSGFRPTAHISFDSTEIYPPALADIEAQLYGTESTDPVLPDLQTLIALFFEEGMLAVVDNGDGTWTVTAPDEVISMLDSETFQITHVTPTWVNPDTYTIGTQELTREA